MRILKYTISLLLLLSGLEGRAQEGKKDFVPSEILFSTDVVGLAKTLFSDNNKLEFQAKIDFHHFYLVGEWGLNQINPVGPDFNYSSKGSFYRIGPQVNLMPYNKHRSSIFFGVMYAGSSFQDQIEYFKADTGWGDQNIGYSNDNLESSWFEANVGMHVRVAGPLYLGYTLRFQFANKLSGYETLYPLEIPGFGAADRGSNFGFNYYLIYKLRFRDKPIPVRPVKKKDEASRKTN